MGAEPTIGFVLDGLIAVLLILTIGSGFMLNRRIEILRRSAIEIQGVMGGFDRATNRAQAGVEALKSAVKDAGRQLQDQINTARGLRDELKRHVRAPGGPDAKIDARGAKAEALARSLLGRAAKPPRPAMADAAMATDSEVERELRELLRHVR